MIASRLVTSQVWLVTGSQSLYGQDILDQVADQSRQIAEQLDGSSRDSRRGALASGRHRRRPDRPCAERGQHQLTECIGVIAWMHTFSPAKMWIRGLKSLQKPLLHLHTQFGVELPWHSIDMDFMNLNQAAHGDREFGYIQSRLSTPRKTIAGHVSDPHTRRRIGSWVRAALGRAELSTLKVARFGDNMRGVAVTEGDKVEAEAHFGASINTYGVNDLVECVGRVRPADVDKLVREYEDTYAVAAELLPGGDRHASLRHGAQIELGLRKFLQDGDFHAFTTNFEDLGGLRQLPGLAVQRLMADGYGFGGEGDWKTAMMLRASQGHGRGAARRHVVHGGLHLRPDAGPGAHPRSAHARGVPQHRGGDADPGSASAVDRWPRRSGAAALHRGPVGRGHHRHLRHGFAIPVGGQRGSRRRARPTSCRTSRSPVRCGNRCRAGRPRPRPG